MPERWDESDSRYTASRPRTAFAMANELFIIAASASARVTRGGA